MFVYRAAQNGMGTGVAGGVHFPAAVDEVVAVLCGHNRIEHNGKIAAGGVFHTGRYVHAADCQAVLLVLYRTGSDRYVRKQVR